MREILSAIEERLEEPTSKALAGAVSRAIRDGVLSPGDQLPPIRTVAAQLALSPTTVSAAWRMLSRSGAVRTDGRRGTTVADPQRGAAARYTLAVEHDRSLELDLSSGVPDADLLPDIGPALRHTRTAGTPSSYLEAPVVPELEAALATEWPCPATRFAILDGAMDAIDLFVRVHLGPGERVVVEDPGFPPLLDLLESAGLEVVGAPMGPEGIDLAALPLLGGPVAAVFLQPRAQNPTGVSLTPAHAQRLADLLQRDEHLSRAIVVEDDSTGHLSTSDPISLATWLPHRTLHVRSFSKSHGPDLRLAAVSGPDDLLDAMHRARTLGQGWSSRLLQRILHTLLTTEESVRAVADAREEYARRRTALVNALAERGVHVEGTEGLNIWVPVADETAAMVHLASHGIAAAAGAPFRVHRARSDAHLRITSGLLADRHDEIADVIAAAAGSGSWLDRQR